MAKDLFHQAVKQALIKDGWTPIEFPDDFSAFFDINIELEGSSNKEMMIYPATSKREFVEGIVNETANDRLY